MTPLPEENGRSLCYEPVSVVPQLQYLTYGVTYLSNIKHCNIIHFHSHQIGVLTNSTADDHEGALSLFRFVSQNITTKEGLL